MNKNRSKYPSRRIFYICGLTSIVSVCFLFVFQLTAQNADELERQYYIVAKEADNFSANRDSLQKRIDRQLENLRLEKEKSVSDKDRLKRMMADIIELRAQLKIQEKSSEALQRKTQKLRDQLQIAYQHAVDSLTGKKSITIDKQELKNIEETIAFILEKQLILTPVIRPLAFRWSEIEKLSPAETADSLEIRFLADYIRGAMAEIDERIAAMEKARSKYDEMLAFQKKLETFTDDLESPFFTVQNRGMVRYGKDAQSGYNEIGIDVWRLNVQSLKGIVFQLYKEIPILKKNHSIKDDQIINYEDYIELIKLAEKALLQYRKILRQKSDALQKSFK